MELHFFGRVFDLLTNSEQKERMYSYLQQYWTGNAISMAALVCIIGIIIVAFAVIPVKGTKKNKINRILAVAYAVALYFILVVSRKSGTRELRPLAISDYLTSENGFHESEVLIACLYIVMFFPFGMLLRRACNTLKGWMSLTGPFVLALAFGILIEGSQYVLAKGVTYPGHVIAYLIGAILGQLIMGIGLRRFKHR